MRKRRGTKIVLSITELYWDKKILEITRTISGIKAYLYKWRIHIYWRKIYD
jgi:hypothetical protein